VDHGYALACLGLLAGAVVDLASSHAHALELACAAPTVYVGDARAGSNPVIGVYVNHDLVGWTVIYKLADGQLINRAAQYDMRETSNAYRSTWAGRLRVQPWLIMIGEITRVGSGLSYRERIIDQHKGEAITMEMATDNCTAPLAAQAPVPAPPVIVSAPAPADNARLDEIERKLNDLLSRPAPAPAPAPVTPVIINAPSAPVPAPAPVIINIAPAAPSPAPPIIVNAPAAPVPVAAPAAPAPVAAPTTATAPAPAPGPVPAAAPTPAPEAKPAPTPALAVPAFGPKPAPPGKAPEADWTPPAPPVPAPRALDEAQAKSIVPLTIAGPRMLVDVRGGGWLTAMQVDTGCDSLTVSQTIADDLVARGEAERIADRPFQLADGSVKQMQEILVQCVEIGSITIRNIEASIVPDNTDMLLGMSVLAKAGRFTIDRDAKRLVFD
jgi:hypothetical protein